MPELSTILLFMIAGLGLLVIPGPAVLYIVARSVHQGRRAGLISALGVGLGAMGHVVAATIGLSALIASSALAFSIVKYAGAAYLIYLGIRTLLGRDEHNTNTTLAPRKMGSIFYQGFLVELLNPKTALFFLAFLPQFIDPAKGAVVWQTLFLGCLFVGLGICSDGFYALISGTAGNLLKGSVRFLQVQRYVTGSIYIGLGLTTGLTGSDRK